MDISEENNSNEFVSRESKLQKTNYDNNGVGNEAPMPATTTPTMPPPMPATTTPTMPPPMPAPMPAITTPPMPAPMPATTTPTMPPPILMSTSTNQALPSMTTQNNKTLNQRLYAMLVNALVPKNDYLSDEDDEFFDNFIRSINNLPDVDSVQKLPDVNSSDIAVGSEIYLKSYKYNTMGNPDPIFIVENINTFGNYNEFQIKKISNLDDPNVPSTLTIKIEDIYNVININPQSLHINKQFKDRLDRTVERDFSNDRKGIISTVKYLRQRIVISKIKIKIYKKQLETNPNEQKGDDSIMRLIEIEKRL